jgi:endoglucanase
MGMYLRRFYLACALCGVFLCLSYRAESQASPDALAFARAAHLQRGINASIWFAQSPNNYSVERLETFTTPRDIALMAAMGLDHVRLSVDAVPLAEWQRSPGQSTPFMTELDRVVKLIVDNHLSVIIDIHPEDSYKAPLRSGDASVEQFNLLWRDLARHFAHTDPEHVFFEIMNEPEQDDSYRWQGIESRVAATIRQEAPQHTIIAAGAHYSGLQDLLRLEPIGLPNVIYTFHDYEPFAFTHQGATWTSVEVRPLRQIPYPSTPEDIAPRLGEEPTLEGQFFLEEYGWGRWDDARVEATVAYAAKWGRLHGVPVYCGEFGVMRAYAVPAQRAQWLHDMRVAFEKNKIGWAMWDYQTNFGLVTKQNGVTTPDAEVLRALGLHQPQ